MLRQDYGWKARFGSQEAAGGGSHLMCTAEVGAALLERAGDEEGGRRVRERLDAFQAEYVRAHPHLVNKAREHGLVRGCDA